MSGSPNTEQTRPVRAGLIGCGGIGSIRAQALARTSSFKLTAVSDVDAGRAAAAAQTAGASIETDWRALVARDDVDAVVIATPPHLHAEMCVGALEAGKHVLCEKPLARTPDECERVVRE